MVANQLLQGSKTPPPTTSGQGGIVEDVRTPPKMKNQQSQKNKVNKPVNSPPKSETIENSHAGVAIPMNPDDMNKTVLNTDQTPQNNVKESSTSDEGLSTWILLSGSPTTASPKTEYTKVEDLIEKENKKQAQGNRAKPKIPAKPTRSPSVITVKPAFIRKPVAIGSSNKSDLIASGSAVNENVMNKIKASVLASIQKNKNAALNKTTTTTTPTPVVLLITSKKETKEVTTESNILPIKVHSNLAPSVVKKTENKPIKAPTTLNQDTNKSSELLESREEANDSSIESKHAEIELEVSTPPPSTTKKPKRTSNKRKKNKNRHRKPLSTTIKPEEITLESKIRKNETKIATKISQNDKPITTQIYNYLSREVMPTVGVGLVSLAGIVGLASYLFYPFGGIVRRTYNVNDRKDDLYQQNGELYAGEGGQREEEMLGSLFPETPVETHKAKNKVQTVNINPYAAQTPFTYPQAKPTQPNPEANIRYRNVAYGSDSNSFVSSDRVGQQNEDTIHGSAYSEHIQYNTHSADQNDRFSPLSYSQPQPVYTAPDLQTENPGYISESAQQSYGIQNNIPDAVYEYGHAMRYSQELTRETTKSPIQETLHLGSEDVIEQQKETGYTVDAMGIDENKQPQFVVGNVPKELIQAVTPISVPEHGPRNLRRRKRNIPVQQHDVEIQSAADSLKEILGAPRDDNYELNKNVDKSYKEYFPEPLPSDQLPSPKEITVQYDTEKDNSKEKQNNLKDNWIKYNKKPQKNNGENSKEILKEDYSNLVHLRGNKNPENQETSENNVNHEYSPKFEIPLTKIKPEHFVKTELSEKNTHIGDKYSDKYVFEKNIPGVSKDVVKSEDSSAENEKIDHLKTKMKAFSFTEKDTMKDEKYSQKVKHQIINSHESNNEASPEIIMAIPYQRIVEKIPEKNTPNSEKIITEHNYTNTFVDQVIPPSTSNKSAATQFIDLNDQTSQEVPLSEEMQTNFTSPAEISTKPNTYNIPESTENPPEPFSLINFFKSLLDFKLRLGINVLQTTSEKLAKYLKDVENSFQIRPSNPENSYRQYHYYY